MPKTLMYNATNERIWFPRQESEGLKIGINQGFNSRLRISYPDFVLYTPGYREDYVYGHVIPSELVRNVRLSGKKPHSQEIRESIFDLVPRYRGMDYRYWETHTPVEALERKQGGCKERASVGAAIAQVNSIAYRIVGSQDLTPDDTNGRLVIPSRIFGLFPQAVQKPYHHWWLEVYEDSEWIAVDTVEWNPVSFEPFKKKVEERIVCKEIKLSEVFW